MMFQVNNSATIFRNLVIAEVSFSRYYLYLCILNFVHCTALVGSRLRTPGIEFDRRKCSSLAAASHIFSIKGAPLFVDQKRDINVLVYC